MNGQYEKSLHTLELPAVLQMLAAQAVCETAKQNCLQLRPVSEKGMVRRRLAETSAAKQMMVLKGSPSFYGIKDVRCISAEGLDIWGADVNAIMDAAKNSI